MITSSIQIRQHTFELHPLRALWWEKQSILICSDVHIGKAAHFRKAGIPIPKAVNASNLWNLVVLIEKYVPEKIVFLGDLFHSRSNNEWEELMDMLAQFPQIELLLIKGNHEVELSDTYEKLGIRTVDSITIEGIHLTHEPTSLPETAEYVLCGHLHPSVRLSGMANQQLRLPCFWFGDAMGVMPAFGEFTGTHTIQPKKGDQVFVIAENRVMQIG